MPVSDPLFSMKISVCFSLKFITGHQHTRSERDGILHDAERKRGAVIGRRETK